MIYKLLKIPNNHLHYIFIGNIMEIKKGGVGNSKPKAPVNPCAHDSRDTSNQPLCFLGVAPNGAA
jgi:hypothetical protein